jgi:iron complex transport system permease protein
VGKKRAVLIALAVLLLLAFLLHVGMGSYLWYWPWDTAAEILRGPMENPTTENVVVWATRLPRAVQALLVGCTLGFVGSAFQAQLRNPLVEPYTVGVSSGAAVGAVLSLLLGFGTMLGGLPMMACGFLTGMASLLLVYWLASRRGLVDVTALLLSGVAVSALLSALTSLALLACGRDTNMVLGWLLGSISAATWQQNGILAIFTVAGAAVLVLQSRNLNAFAIGEDTASRLGVDVPRLRSLILAVGTAMTAAAVGAVGIIGFLGLVAPHIARKLLGVDWRYSLLGSGLLGGLLLLLSDIIAQRGMSALTHTPGMEIPVGIVTAVVGAPSLLALLKRTN